MKDVFLLYDTSCIYEIVTLNYFMRFTGCDVAICTLDGKPVRAMEGYSITPDMSLEDVDMSQIRSFILPGGSISAIDQEPLRKYLQELARRKILIAGICAGVDVLDHAGILTDRSSTHSTNSDLVNDRGVITARANAYVDFAIETAKELGLFADETDLQETIAFWKNHHRMQ